MKPFLHVTNTWLVAQVLHPWILLLGIALFSGWADIWIIPLGYAFGFLFSLPGYLLCLLFFQPIMYSEASGLIRLFKWLCTSIVSIIAGAFLISLVLFDARAFTHYFVLVIPGCVAAVISIFIRIDQFMHFNQPQLINYEADMV